MPSTLLAGPILRRVEKNRVSVWLAFSKHQHSITLNIYEAARVKDETLTVNTGSLNPTYDIVPNAPQINIFTGSTSTKQVGKRLFIALVTVDIPTPGLDISKVYSYDVVFTSEDPIATYNLKSAKLLEDGKGENRKLKALGYKKSLLPSFVLPPEEYKDLYIAQASCRKMHGAGEDALSYLDGIIKKSVTNSSTTPKPRPQQLFLTGDQIYSDDVPAILLKYCGKTNGDSLIGNEKIQLKAEDGEIKNIEANTTQFPIMMRQNLIEKFAALSSHESSSHLISFQEFCGVYLNYWNILSWEDSFFQVIKSYKKAEGDKGKENIILDKFLFGTPDAFVETIKDSSNQRTDGEAYIFPQDIEDDDDEEKDLAVIFAENPNDPKLKAWLGAKRKSLRKEFKKVASFMDTLPAVSRVMANVPCYMIFDDHEITDDWFITKSWKESAFSSPLGRDIYRNGIMAYAIFQDWGNSPLEYEAPIFTETEVEQLLGQGFNVPTEIHQVGTAVMNIITNAAKLKVSDEKAEKIGEDAGRIAQYRAYSEEEMFEDDPNSIKQIVKEDMMRHLKNSKHELFTKIIDYGQHLAADSDAAELRNTIIPEMEQLLGMVDETPSPLFWNYNVRSGKGHTYVLDTRTRRKYDSQNAIPGLLNKAALESQIPRVLPDGADFIMVVSPAPILGLASFEELLQPLGVGYKGIGNKKGVVAGALEFDVEAWGFHIENFEKLLNRLSSFPKVIVLSGDVHYGHSSVLDYWKKDAENPVSRILQFTASASKNMWFDNAEMLKTGLIQRIIAQFHSSLEKIGWKDKVVAIEDDGYVSPYNRARLRAGLPTRTGYAVIPVGGWVPGTTVNQEPDYRWRLRIACDSSQGGIIDDDIVPNGAVLIESGYRAIIQKHHDTFVSGIARQIIFPSNVGLVTFEEMPDGELQVKHALLYREGKRDGTMTGKIDGHTKHNFSFILSDEEKTAPVLPEVPVDIA